jgi:hypothetical protein
MQSTLRFLSYCEMQITPHLAFIISPLSIIVFYFVYNFSQLIVFFLSLSLLISHYFLSLILSLLLYLKKFIFLLSITLKNQYISLNINLIISINVFKSIYWKNKINKYKNWLNLPKRYKFKISKSSISNLFNPFIFNNFRFKFEISFLS